MSSIQATQHRPGYPPARALLALIMLGLPQAAAMAQDGPPPALVRVGQASYEEVRERRPLVGYVEPGRRSIIAAEEPGRVREAPPDAGARVSRGDALASIDTTLLEVDLESARSDVDQAEADVEERRSQLKLSQRERERTENLFESGAAREKEFQDSRDREAGDRARLRAAEASLRRARAEHARIERRLEQAQVTAPFDAYVVRKQTEVGQWLSEGDPVAEIVELDTVKIQLDVPERMIELVPQDEPLGLTIEALNETFDGQFFAIVPDGNARSRTFRVTVHVQNGDGRIRPGMSVRAHLPTGVLTQAITVPRDAVHRTSSGAVVYVERNGAAHPVPVEVRFGSGDRFVLQDTAIEDGERVVVQGNERLAAGQPLQIVDDADALDTAEAPEDPSTDL